MADKKRSCPYCDGEREQTAYPFRSKFDKTIFSYLRCARCGLISIDPLPSDEQFARMYATGDYHDEFYDGDGQGAYALTADRLIRHMPKGARVLDFGCGAGHLLTALKAREFKAFGTEFSESAAANAARRSGCEVFNLGDDNWKSSGPWDCIHFGDVIEHLPDPKAVLRECLGLLARGGGSLGRRSARGKPVAGSLGRSASCKP